jgi:hypothetical protein
MRFFYKDAGGQVYEYETQAERDQFGAPDLTAMTADEVAAHLTPALTADQTIEAMRNAIQAHMDTAAKGYGYDDVKVAVTYAEEPSVPKFQAEGLAFRAWRSLVWAYAYDVLDKVQAGERTQPTADELIAELPALVIDYETR